MLITRTLAAGVAAAGLALAGCGGGSSSDEDQIRDAINAVADDPTAICDYISADFEKTIEAIGECEDFVETDEDRPASTEVEINSVEVDGDKATATITTEEDGEETVELIKEGDGWKFAETVE